MSDSIRVGTNASLTVAEAASDDGLILTEPDGNSADEDECANRSLAAFTQEGGEDQ